MTNLTAPFPYAGNKAKVAALVWDRFGNPDAYVEPFCGAAGVLLGRPYPGQAETLNDLSGYVTNAWRAIKADPDAVADACDWPINEIDLFARHVELLKQSDRLAERLQSDPRFFDSELAAWWIWGASSWIGSGWCSGNGAWSVENGAIAKVSGAAGDSRQLPDLGANDTGNETYSGIQSRRRGVRRSLEAIGADGKGNESGAARGVHSDRARGVDRKLPHVGANGKGQDANARGENAARRRGASRQMPKIGANSDGVDSAAGGENAAGRRGAARQLPAIGANKDGGGPVAQGVHTALRGSSLRPYFALLAERLRSVRIVCGDWRRVVKPRITTAFGVAAVFLDPPYPGTITDFYQHGQTSVWYAAQRWAILNGSNPQYRIALCGLTDQHMPRDWTAIRWKRSGGYGSQGQGAGRENAGREVIWFSPYCGQLSDLPMFVEQTWQQTIDSSSKP